MKFSLVMLFTFCFFFVAPLASFLPFFRSFVFCFVQFNFCYKNIWNVTSCMSFLSSQRLQSVDLEAARTKCVCVCVRGGNLYPNNLLRRQKAQQQQKIEGNEYAKKRGSERKNFTSSSNNNETPCVVNDGKKSLKKSKDAETARRKYSHSCVECAAFLRTRLSLQNAWAFFFCTYAMFTSRKLKEYIEQLR